MKQNRKLPIALLLITAIVLGCLLQFLCYRYDNKYTYPRPVAENGLIRLNTDRYDSEPFFYLIEGWSFYDGKLLMPETVGSHTPDDHFYIGRYGGLNREDTTRSAAGQATYRLRIQTDETPRTFSLELTGVYDRHRLWVNGELLQSVGYAEENVNNGSIVTFTAANAIELIVAVESDGRGFYSGLVYPPALGSPDRVAQTAALRLLLHSAACAVALLVCFLCLMLAIGNRAFAPYGFLSLLCLCFLGAAAWAIYPGLGLTVGGVVLERVCHYGIFLCVVLLQNRLCGVPKKLSILSGAMGLLICLAVAVRPLISFETAAVNLVWSQMLTIYKWLTAAYLLLCAVWALVGNTRYSAPLLAGNCAFAAALVMNRLLPMHEPILLGGNIEIAGFLWMVLLTALIGHDAVRTYREREALQHKQAIAQIQLAAWGEHARLQQEYVRLTRARLHESRSRLMLIRHYLDRGEYDKLTLYLEQLSADGVGVDALQHTGNSLVDAILTLGLSHAEKLGAYVERDFGALPDPLPIEDADMTGLLMNSIENALEAVERIAEPAERWLRLRLERAGEMLIIECENATVLGEKQASKPDKFAHGFGIPLIRSTAAKYGGKVLIERQEDSFLLSVSIPVAEEMNQKSAQG